MKIVVKIRTNSRTNEVEKIDDGDYLIHVTDIPVDNTVNEKVIELLGNYFGIAINRLRVIRGVKSTQKIIEIS